MKGRKGFIIDLSILNNIPWKEIADHIITSRLEMFTLFGEAWFSFIGFIASFLTDEPASWIWIPIMLNCAYSQYFTWGTVVYCFRHDIEEGWLIVIGLVLDFAITAIPSHWWEALAHIGAILLLLILKHIAEEHQYYNHVRQIKRTRY